MTLHRQTVLAICARLRAFADDLENELSEAPAVEEQSDRRINSQIPLIDEERKIPEKYLSQGNVLGAQADSDDELEDLDQIDEDYEDEDEEEDSNDEENGHFEDNIVSFLKTAPSNGFAIMDVSRKFPDLPEYVVQRSLRDLALKKIIRVVHKRPKTYRAI